jgi:hypothetical protein
MGCFVSKTDLSYPEAVLVPAPPPRPLVQLALRIELAAEKEIAPRFNEWIQTGTRSKCYVSYDDQKKEFCLEEAKKLANRYYDPNWKVEFKDGGFGVVIFELVSKKQ